VADEAHEKGRKKKKKRGPRGGIAHTPGRGHATGSQSSKKRRIGKRKVKRRKEREEEARKQWEAYDRLPDEAKKLLGQKGKPKLPRPTDET
jgi:hypothetical protein